LDRGVGSNLADARSNKLRRAPRPDDAPEGGVPIEMPKGSGLLHHGVWHWQG